MSPRPTVFQLFTECGLVVLSALMQGTGMARQLGKRHSDYSTRHSPSTDVQRHPGRGENFRAGGIVGTKVVGDSVVVCLGGKRFEMTVPDPRVSDVAEIALAVVSTRRVVVGLWTESSLSRSLGLGNKGVSGCELNILEGMGVKQPQATSQNRQWLWRCQTQRSNR